MGSSARKWVSMFVLTGLLAFTGYFLFSSSADERFRTEWIERLRALSAPERLSVEGFKSRPGDLYSQKYSDGGWFVAVSASSCGNGSLHDIAIFKDSRGHIYTVEGIHFCGGGGIPMAMHGLFGNSLEEFDTAMNSGPSSLRVKRIQ